ncbi:MAG: anthranilate synthase component II [Nitrososphaeria archaeon]
MRAKLALIIDNYDSFVYNIAQMVGQLGAVPLVIRNDEIRISGIRRLWPDRIIISPGPGNPEVKEDVGISPEVVQEFAGKIPILGICLGHQVIGHVYGARIRNARRIMHGKISRIKIIKKHGVFKSLPDEIEGTRYHSLVIDDVKPPLEVTAVSDDGEVMAVASSDLAVYGVQFHPESIGTQFGLRIFENVMELEER